jgi:hypothetical protein
VGFQTRIVEVKQGGLAGAIGVVDGNSMAALTDEACSLILVQARTRNRDRGRALAPEMDEMRLAATRRTVQHQRSGGPIGPPIYPTEGRRVAVRNEKICAAQCGAARQIESELDGPSRNQLLSSSLYRAVCR